MNWFEQIDGYCERTDFTYWSEPLNALTNLAFIIAALILWRRSAGIPMARVLSAILFIIGVGSFLFHTHATIWASVADVAPIGVFILTYLFVVNRDIVPMGGWMAAFATALFIPYAAALVPVLNRIPFVAISNFYWTVPILLILYAIFLRRKPQIARGFLIGAALLAVSIIIRSLDEILCDVIPIGTHFIWHILNGIMLGWMIHVYIRHMLATARTGR
ncbi:MAG: ceramidase domain-containing protein [Yoonia sp.]|uniref:ceramidase domain-containing protein n=1 Tax=Yoonia sp. TaxID=2212373 RepID=UPI003EF8AB60